MNPKQAAGEKAVDFIEDGMVLGLGSGTTTYYTIRKIGEMVSSGLKITGVCTSEATRLLAEKWNIPYVSIDEVEKIDLTIDGADEVDPMGNGIKGGGGALLFEKMVATVSRQVIWVIEQRKLVDRLGAFPLPVEILPFGHTHCIRRIQELGLNPELRYVNGEIFRTDGGHYIVDLHTGPLSEPGEVVNKLVMIPGVIEHGLFLDLVNRAVVATMEKVDIITYR